MHTSLHSWNWERATGCPLMSVSPWQGYWTGAMSSSLSLPRCRLWGSSACWRIFWWLYTPRIRICTHPVLFICSLLWLMIAEASNGSKTIVITLPTAHRHGRRRASRWILTTPSTSWPAALARSICSLSIAVDRYSTIFYALQYHSIMTVRRGGVSPSVPYLGGLPGVRRLCSFTQTAALSSSASSPCSSPCWLSWRLLLSTCSLARLHTERIVLPGTGAIRARAPTWRGRSRWPSWSGLCCLLGPLLPAPDILHLLPPEPLLRVLHVSLNLYLILIKCVILSSTLWSTPAEPGTEWKPSKRSFAALL